MNDYAVLFRKGILILISLLYLKCQPETNWKFSGEIHLETGKPLGIVADNGRLWISDADNNRVVLLDLGGSILKEYSGFKRPMHLDISDDKIYIPEYLTDSIRIIDQEGMTTTFALAEKPDAPASIDKSGDLVAVADFFNHRIILQNSDVVTLIGKEGHGPGELYYPTDVAILDPRIYVADAYNNRVQVFDLEGNSLKILADGDGINVASGIAVNEQAIFVTDYYGNRILIYDHEGQLQQILSEHLEKPTDIAISDDKMYVANFGKGAVGVYEK